MRWFARQRKKAGFDGDFRSFSEARRASLGYQHADTIADVQKKRAKYLPPEGFITRFDAHHIAAFYLSGIGPRAHVVDFGGGLGSSCLAFHKHVSSELKWTVVETPAMVDAANSAGLNSAKLAFTTTMPESGVQFILANGVLQCLEYPMAQLDEFSRHGAPVCLNRVPLFERQVIAVQTFRSENGWISIPAWFFDAAEFEAALQKNWTVRLRWRTEDVVRLGASRLKNVFQGMLIEPKQPRPRAAGGRRSVKQS